LHSVLDRPEGQLRGAAKTHTVLQNPSHYDRVTIILHWTTAALVIVLWLIGMTGYSVPREARNLVWSIHITLGFTLLVVLVARLAWRLTPRSRRPLPIQGFLKSIANFVHFLLYALLTIVLALGIWQAFVRGYNIFGVLKLPQLGDFSQRQQINYWHYIAANTLMGVTLCHAVSALVHHYVWRDDVLRRMLCSDGSARKDDSVRAALSAPVRSHD